MENTIDYVIREEPDTSSPTYEIYQPDPAPAYLVASKYHRRNRHQRKNFIDLSDEEEQQNINIEKCDYCSDNSRQGQEEEDEEYHTAMDECNPVTYVVIGRGNSNYDDDDSVIDLDPDDDDDAGGADYRVEQETGTPLTTSGSLKENEAPEVEEEATETPDKRKMVAKKAAMGRKAKAAKKAAAAAKHREAIKKYHASRKLQ